MIKKPKRDLKVKNAFNLQDQNTRDTSADIPQQQTVHFIQQSTPPVDQKQPIPYQNVVQHNEKEQELQQTTPHFIKEQEKTNHYQILVQPPSEQEKVILTPFVPVEANIKSEAPQRNYVQAPIDSKKSKLEELKQKYLKKNLTTNPQTPQTPQPSHSSPSIQPNNPQPRVVPIQNQKQTLPKKVQQPQTTSASQFFSNLDSSYTKESKINQQITKNDPSTSSSTYETNFVPIIQEKVKARPVPPPVKRQIGNARNPFQLKGTYTKPESLSEVSQNKVQQSHQKNIIKEDINNRNLPVNQLEQQQQQIANPFGEQKQFIIPNIDFVHNSSPNQIKQQNHSALNLNYSLIVKNPQSFVIELYSNNLISEQTHTLCQQRLFQKHQPQHHQLEIASIHPEFNTWVSRLFKGTILNSQTIHESNAELVDDILNEFFLPLGQQFSPLFIISLSKLPQQYYVKYQNYLLSNPNLYVNIVAEYSSYISKTKIKDFLSFIQQNLNTEIQNYTEIIIKMFLISAEIINENSLITLTQKCSFEQAVILLQILCKQKSKFIKYNIQIANIVIKRLEQNKEVQTGLELLKQLNEQLGTPAYSLLKEARQRLIKSIGQPQQQNDAINQAKNVATNFFGFLTNAVDKMINKQPGQSQPSKAVQKQPQVKESIYYDQAKKRWVLNGEIPDDEEQQKEVLPKETIPPPPQIRNPPPPPLGPAGVNSNKRPNRIPANRYV